MKPILVDRSSSEIKIIIKSDWYSIGYTIVYEFKFIIYTLINLETKL